MPAAADRRRLSLPPSPRTTTGSVVGGVGGFVAVCVIMLVVRKRRATAAAAGGSACVCVSANVTTGALPGVKTRSRAHHHHHCRCLRRRPNRRQHPHLPPACGPAPCAPPDTLCATHVVQSGDSLWSISNQYGATTDELQAALAECLPGWNAGVALQVGQKICLPGYVPAELRIRCWITGCCQEPQVRTARRLPPLATSGRVATAGSASCSTLAAAATAAAGPTATAAAAAGPLWQHDAAEGQTDALALQALPPRHAVLPLRAAGREQTEGQRESMWCRAAPPAGSSQACSLRHAAPPTAPQSQRTPPSSRARAPAPAPAPACTASSTLPRLSNPACAPAPAPAPA